MLSTEQVGALLDIGRDGVLAMLRRGDLRGTRTGHPWRIAAEAVWPLVPPEIRETWPTGPWSAKPIGALLLTKAGQASAAAPAAAPLEAQLDGKLLDELRATAEHFKIPPSELLEQALRIHLTVLRQALERHGDHLSQQSRDD